MELQSNMNTALALDFARAISTGNRAHAHALLSSALQAATTPDQLAADYARMVEYGEGPPGIIQVMTSMTEWPDKTADDREWIYVAIANDTYSEAVTVVVAREEARLVIRSIEWGRP